MQGVGFRDFVDPTSMQNDGLFGSFHRLWTVILPSFET